MINQNDKSKNEGETDSPVYAAIDKYKEKPEALVELLKEVKHLTGSFSEKILNDIANELNIPLSDIYTILNIYPEFYASEIKKKDALHNICVCKGTSCYIRGSNRLLDKISSELGIKPGETTSDGRHSLDIIRCTGACALGPVITIGDTVYPRVTPEKIPEIIKKNNS